MSCACEVLPHWLQARAHQAHERAAEGLHIVARRAARYAAVLRRPRSAPDPDLEKLRYFSEQRLKLLHQTAQRYLPGNPDPSLLEVYDPADGIYQQLRRDDDNGHN